MHELGLLREILVIVLAAIVIIPLFRFLRLPAMVGFLVTGILIGPYGLQLIQRIDDVNTLAEVGVVLLLFTIGLEFSLQQMNKIRTLVLLGGGLQVVITICTVAGIMLVLGFTLQQSVFIGFLLSLSSTAIVMKILADRGETTAPYGKISLAFLLFQDFCLVPMMLFVPVLSDAGAVSSIEIVVRLGTALLAIVLIIIAARYIIPLFMEQLVKSQSRELFVLGVVLVSLGTAWVTSFVGLSLALGAFVAGIMLSESEYSHQIVAEVLPMRDVLSSIFFISIGMLLNVGQMMSEPILLIGSSVVLMILKFLLAALVVLLLRFPLRIAIIAGLALSQVGEFSFILARAGMDAQLLSAESFQRFIVLTIVTMLVTPFIIQFAPIAAERLQRVYPKFFRDMQEADQELARELQGHVIIVGYGLNGKNLATVLKETGIPYVILELDAEIVREARAQGEPIVFGDATRALILSHCHIERARVLVVSISDPTSTRQIVRIARGLNPSLHIVVRTRYVAEIEDLYTLGADQVIPEEFETSIEIFTRVLREYHIPRNVIATQVDLIRQQGYGMLRGLRLPEASMKQLEKILAAGTTDTFLVLDESPANGKTLAELNIRKTCGALVIGVVRNDKPITNPPPDFRVESGDVLVLIGTHAEIDAAFDLLSPPRTDGQESS